MKRIFIFDWDDTLFPTTELSKNKQSYTEKIDEVFLSHYAKLEETILQLFEMIVAKHGSVYIVTNSDEGWIPNLLTMYFPKLKKWLLEHQITIISAKSKFQHLLLSYNIESDVRPSHSVNQESHVRPSHSVNQESDVRPSHSVNQESVLQLDLPLAPNTKGHSVNKENQVPFNKNRPLQIQCKLLAFYYVCILEQMNPKEDSICVIGDSFVEFQAFNLLIECFPSYDIKHKKKIMFVYELAPSLEDIDKKLKLLISTFQSKRMDPQADQLIQNEKTFFNLQTEDIIII